MSESEKTAIAAHLYVTLRRKLNRLIDVEWLLKNEDYAREVIGMSRQQGLEDLAHYADRMEEMIFGRILVKRPIEPKLDVVPKIVAESAQSSHGSEGDESTKRYIGTLR